MNQLSSRIGVVYVLHCWSCHYPVSNTKLVVILCCVDVNFDAALHFEWIYNSRLNPRVLPALQIYFMFMPVQHTWIAVRAATMAGDPKPWVMREKFVRCRWMFWSRIIAGLVLQRGERSWFKRSISSFVTILKTNFHVVRFKHFEQILLCS